MKKVDGVQNVKVSLKDGLTILDLKPANTVTLKKLRQIIKDNGFVSKEASAIARGTPKDGGFVVSGTNEELTLLAEARAMNQEWSLAIRP